MPLSQGDTNTLNTIYKSVVATVSTVPAARVSNFNGVNFNVTGKGVTEYQIKLGRAESVNCKSGAGYSDFRPVSQGVTGMKLAEDFLATTSPVSGDYRICLIGRNGSVTQPYVSYSSIDLTVR
ncbi:MAG TPA: hypothetical protein VE954_16670 [Oligoflexus sp.]|uniref:hypothetical protein n=1 Tax=Oligoflexus sp. TaxID=1971216 RepID=UPI002D4959B1|nr:hypothetical protein [Oligoflexus sp.]HYX34733.1 hypothetical protein [Oligoflexus sp.]